MFDLDRLAAFDRGLARLAPPLPGLTRDLAGCSAEAPDHVRGGDGRATARCTMVTSLGVEPLCPFARMETA